MSRCGAVLLCLLCGASATDPIVGINVLKRPKQCHRRTNEGDYILLHYVARVVGQEKHFHSTYEAGAPMPLVIGSGQYFPGFHKGALLNMCEKEVRQLMIPPELAFGKFGFGDRVPPNSQVEYTVKLMGWLDDEHPYR